MASQLKNILLRIQWLLNQGNLDQALFLYEEIDRNWEALKEELSEREVEELYRITSFIASILQEKREELSSGGKYLQARKAYEKFG